GRIGGRRRHEPRRTVAAPRARRPRARLRARARHSAARSAPAPAPEAPPPPTGRRVAPRARRRSIVKRAAAVELPRDTDTVEAAVGSRVVRLTNLRKLFWPELGVTKGDLLRYYAAVAPAAPARPGDGHEALSQRRGGRLLLHEAGALAPSRLDRDLRDRARIREGRELPDDPGPARAALGHQPRLHRPEPLVLALRRHRPPRLPPLRPGSGSGRRLRARLRDRSAGPRGARDP